MAPKPRRSFSSAIESLRQVWRIETLPDLDALWTFGTASQPSFSNETPLRVCIWNMCKGAGGHLFEHDFRVLMYGADLVLAQEALLSERSLKTFCHPGFQALHGASYKRVDGLRDGVLTLSRAELRGPMQRIICKFPEPIFKTPKAALACLVSWEGMSEPLLVVNLHATLVRSKQGAIAEISHLLEQLPVHSGPIIFGGDFNTFTRGYLNGVEARLAQFGLELAPIPNDPRPRTGALDQLFVRGLKVRRAFIDTTIKNSDHFPLLAELELA